ncbi:MAG: cell division protein FtsK [Proteobacteria bacterium]|nr:cell division protein FtsK [Pseudomonadota bacterium]
MASAARSGPLDGRRLLSPALRSLMQRRAAELTGFALGLAGVGLLVALASYHPGDPSFDTASSGPVRNLAGPVGAALADLLLQGFGVAGVLPCVALLAWAWRVASRRGIGSPAARLAATILAMPVLGAALEAVPRLRALGWPTLAGPGGAIGRLLAPAALAVGQGVLGQAGAVLVWGLGAGLAVTLVLLALGLSGGEWGTVGRLVGRVARFSVSSGWSTAIGLGRLGSGGMRILTPLRWRPLRRDTPLADAEPEIRREPGFAAPRAAVPETPAGAVPAPRPTRSAPTRSAPPARTPQVARADTVRKAQQESLPFNEPGWRFPPLSLLKPPPARAASAPSAEALEANARLLETVLSDYGVQGAIVEIRPGPVVTLYELEPAPGIRSARVIGLADDIARSLSVTAVRIATVPGRNVIGIEVPNAKRETVFLSEILGSEDVQKHAGRLALALGKDISGAAIVADLQRMPHLMIAGTTGSGKSVGVNAMILSLLYRLSPDQCRLILIDPKMLELSMYDGIPHLMAPVVTEPAKAVTALKWTVREMERRYRAMSQLGVRNIGGFNDRVADARAKGEVITRRVQTGFDPDTGRPTFEEQPLALEPIPFIVVVVDEMADLMMVAGKDIEAAVQRLAQMARAAGIHVIMATQRPSVDVITGTIKANFPTRISFQVISKFDSRTILGEQGAEQLLGQGDMLYMAGGGRIVRVHGPFVSDDEVEKVVAFLREQGEPAYLEAVTEAEDDEGGGALPGFSGDGGGEAGLYEQAVSLVAREGKASTSFVQRHLNIGYNRAAKLIEQMEKEGVVGAANHVGKREVLIRQPDAEV